MTECISHHFTDNPCKKCLDFQNRNKSNVEMKRANFALFIYEEDDSEHFLRFQETCCDGRFVQFLWKHNFLLLEENKEDELTWKEVNECYPWLRIPKPKDINIKSFNLRQIQSIELIIKSITRK